VYAIVSGSGTESWSALAQYFSGGTSPTKWRIDLNFGSMNYYDVDGLLILTNPSGAVRKMRWTYRGRFPGGRICAQRVSSHRFELDGERTGLAYQVAGPESRRIEDTSRDLVYSGTWSPPATPVTPGNYSGGSLHFTVEHGAAVSYTYTASRDHSLYLGTRKAFSAAQVTIAVDSLALRTEQLLIPGEDVLVRVPSAVWPVAYRIPLL